MRAANDNALLAVASRRSTARYIAEGSAWAIALGIAVGCAWYGAYLAQPLLARLG